MHASPHVVGDVMTRAVAAVGRRAAFKDIVRTMQVREVSALPVVDGTDHVVGVVSEADLLPKEEFRDSDPDRSTQLRRMSDLAKAGSVTAEELMTSPALTVHANTTLAQAARTMARAGVKRLPVVDAEDRLEGVVSRADLLKVFLRPDAQIRAEIVDEVLDDLAGVDPNGVTVTVDDGVATLYGRLERRSLAATLCRQVGRVDGVVDVVSHLSWDRDDTRPELIPLRPHCRAADNWKEQS